MWSGRVQPAGKVCPPLPVPLQSSRQGINPAASWLPGLKNTVDTYSRHFVPVCLQGKTEAPSHSLGVGSDWSQACSGVLGIASIYCSWKVHLEPKSDHRSTALVSADHLSLILSLVTMKPPLAHLLPESPVCHLFKDSCPAAWLYTSQPVLLQPSGLDASSHLKGRTEKCSNVGKYQSLWAKRRTFQG